MPVGKDNVLHAAITRTIARRFNERYRPVLREPEAMVTENPEIPGLDGRKVSQSYGNAIALAMTADETARLIRKTRTDSDPHITFDRDQRPGVSALRTTAEAVNEFLSEHRSRRRESAADRTYIDGILAEGNEHANAIDSDTLAEVRSAMGMNCSRP